MLARSLSCSQRSHKKELERVKKQLKRWKVKSERGCLQTLTAQTLNHTQSLSSEWIRLHYIPMWNKPHITPHNHHHNIKLSGTTSRSNETSLSPFHHEPGQSDEGYTMQTQCIIIECHRRLPTASPDGSQSEAPTATVPA